MALTLSVKGEETCPSEYLRAGSMFGYSNLQIWDQYQRRKWSHW